ncbi:hypothetical protein FRC91_04975 [Bradymonadales bacterium TMQ1]|nr:hypothetical protein FRC91_04975 [Bradymonadales bacterium TMQ1]
MTRRRAGIGTAALALCLSLASVATAEQPDSDQGAGGLELPPAFAFLETLERVHNRTRSALWRCAGASEAICPCVSLDTDGEQVSLVEVDARGSELRVAELRVRSPQALWVARDVVFERGPGSHPRATLGELRWRGAHDPTIFRAERAFADWSQFLLEAHTVRWQHGLRDVERSELPLCDARSVDALDPSWPDSSGLRLEEVRFAGNEGWSLSGADVAGRLPVARRLPPGERVSGLVPPALRVTPGGAQLELGYFWAAPSLLMRASLDSAHIAGVGVSRVARPVTCASGRCRLQAFHLDAVFGRDAQTAVSLDGELSVGDARRHLGVALETWQVWGELEATSGHRRRLERNALFRDWRLQRAGVSWAGDASVLQISAAHADLPYVGSDASVEMPGASAVDLFYGGRMRFGAAHAELRLHHSERRDALMKGRFGEAFLGVHRSYGDAGRVWVRPRLNLHLGWADGMPGEATEPPTGPASRATADAIVDAGISLRAQLGPVAHALAPRLVVGRRSHVGERLDAQGMAHAPDAPRLRLAQRDGDFNLAGAVVDQALHFGKGWALSLPLGVMLTDNGRAQHWQTTYQGSLRLVAPALRRLIVSVDAMCHGRCEQPSFGARMEIAWFGTLRSRHVFWRGYGYQPASPLFDSRLRTGYAQGWQPELARVDASTFYTSAVFATWRRWGAELRLHGDVQTLTERGGEFSLRYGWPELGWALSANAAAWPAAGRWAGYVGFSLL